MLGLAGLGRIGQAVARRATALGMRVTAYDPGRPARTFDACGVERRDTLPQVLAEADVVSLHLPLTPETRGLFDARAFATMKRGACLVNVARGDLVDDEALAAALRTGHLSGAALDVLRVEPPLPTDPLPTLDGVVITPHAAWYSPEATTRPFTEAARNVAAALRGRKPPAAVASPTP